MNKDPQEDFALLLGIDLKPKGLVEVKKPLPSAIVLAGVAYTRHFNNRNYKLPRYAELVTQKASILFPYER